MITTNFKEILDSYLNSISIGSFNKNHEMFKLINYTSTRALNEIVSKSNLIAKGSCGAGVWTRYPWIAVYNDKITTSIQRGVYIVYLFSQDMSRVYLSLNQGCTNLKKEFGAKAGRESMINTRNMIRSKLINEDFNTDNDLYIGNVDYEIGSIYYKEYLKGDFPNEEDFLADLYKMVKLYNDYYEQIFLKDNKPEEILEKSTGELSMHENIINIERYIKSKGFIYSYEDLSNFYLSLKTKPFVIIAGISGTGKSKLIKIFGEAIGAINSNERYKIISVKPDWNDSTELLGYKNINDEFIPGQLSRIMLEASKPENISSPYFICLDEMNLARVEYYLSEYLSIIESRGFDHRSKLITDTIFSKGYLPSENPYSSLSIPENVYIIGTVNMDDTTFAFSRKVLDRANTLEFSDVRLDELDFEDDNLILSSLTLSNEVFKSRFVSIKDALNYNRDYVIKINKWIIEINNILATGNKHFGYRVRDEIIFYMLENNIHKLLDEGIAFDYQIMQKILPTITGSDRIIRDILVDLYNYCNPDYQLNHGIDYIKQAKENLETTLYIKSANKIISMLRGYEDGFVSFW